jgi:hypothetical protein
VIIEAHGHAEVVFTVVSAQIFNFVARLRDRIAEASQNHRRNPQYPEIPQPPLREHIFLFSSGRVVVPRCLANYATYHSGSDSSCAIESRIGPQPHKLLLSEN